MSLPRWTSGLWVCALLCSQAQPTLAAGPERPPVQPRETTAPASFTVNEALPDMVLPYGAGYEQRLRFAASKNEPANHAASSASQGMGVSRGGSGSGSGSGSSGGAGGRGNGGSGRGR